jgi:hypothetical protein
VNHVFWTDQVIHRGEPEADFEAEGIEWVPLGKVPALIAEGQIRAAATAAALLLLYHHRPAPA